MCSGIRRRHGNCPAAPPAPSRQTATRDASMRQSLNKRQLACIILVMLAGMMLARTPAMAQAALPPIAPAADALDGPRKLQLEVIINDEPTQLVEPFVHDVASDRFSAKRSDLEEIGIRTPPGEPDEMVFLD